MPFMQSTYEKRLAAQKAQGLADMAAETKQFTSVNPATRAGLADSITPAYAGASYGYDPATGRDVGLPNSSPNLGLAAPAPQTAAPASSIQPAYQGATYGYDPVSRSDVYLTPEMQANDQARITQGRMADLYGQVGGMQSHLTGDTIAGLGRNAFNSPYLQADGADRGVLNAQNGGGHMGRYGSAASEAIMAGADVQRDANMQGLAADIGKYRDSFDTNKANLLHSIAASDPTFQNYDNLYTQGQNFAHQDQALAADQAHYATDRQDRLNQHGNANQTSFVGGLGAAAGGLLSNPTAMGAIGSAFGPIGTGAGLVGSAIYNGLGLAKPPALSDSTQPTTMGGPATRIQPQRDADPYATKQPKRYGLFGGV